MEKDNPGHGPDTIRVNLVSESGAAKAQGVHTAYLQMAHGLRRRQDVLLISGGWQGADIVHIHTVGPYALARLLLRGRSKVVISAHVTPDSFVGSLVGAKRWYGLARWYLRFFYNRGHAVLAVSSEVVTELQKMGVRRPIELMPNTIDTALFAGTSAQKATARQKLGYAPGEFVVIGVGQVQPRKGIDSFLRVAKENPDMRFVWVGGVLFKRLSADHAKMERLMADPPPNVNFAGVMDQQAVVDFYRASDVFWLPSYQETFGIVIVEAAAAGLPVLLRDLPQYRDTFAPGYIAANEAAFAGELQRLKGDAAYRARWTSAANGIAKRYDSVAGTDRLVTLYRRLIAGGL